MKPELTRRNFIQNIGAAGAAAVGVALAVACDSKESAPAQPAAAPKPAAPAPAPKPPAAGGGLACTDLAGLSDADKTMRQTLQYADRSPDPAKLCEGCQLFVPSPDAAKCSTCMVVKGPIHPQGYCTTWVAKAG